MQTILTAALSSRQDIGTFGDHQLILATAPVRTDLIWSMPPNFAGAASHHDFHPKLAPMVDQFRPLVHRWIDQLGSSTRLAIGMTAMLPCDSSQGAYDKLSLLLPGLNLSKRPCRDLTFKINVPITSTVVESVKLNTLTEWTAVMLGAVVLDPGLFGSQAPMPPLDGSANYVRVVTDMNTLPLDGLPITTAQLHGLADELFRTSLATIESGDR